jgi:FtsZ-binding cell division protein ZapB
MTIRDDVRELFVEFCPHWTGAPPISLQSCSDCLSAWADALERRVRAETWDEGAEAALEEAEVAWSGLEVDRFYTSNPYRAKEGKCWERRGDVEAIAAAPEDVAFLLAEVEELGAVLKLEQEAHAVTVEEQNEILAERDDWKANCESWRMAYNSWQDWATTLLGDFGLQPLHGEHGDGPAREVIAKLVARVGELEEALQKIEDHERHGDACPRAWTPDGACVCHKKGGAK